MIDLLLVTSDGGSGGYVYWDEVIGLESETIDEASESSSNDPRAIPV